nr:formin-like protein 3 [Aegilops tauschii subsp. strangulata]
MSALPSHVTPANQRPPPQSRRRSRPTSACHVASRASPAASRRHGPARPIAGPPGQGRRAAASRGRPSPVRPPPPKPLQPRCRPPACSTAAPPAHLVAVLRRPHLAA